jgi:hypothetical protein
VGILLGVNAREAFMAVTVGTVGAIAMAVGLAIFGGGTHIGQLM